MGDRFPLEAMLGDLEKRTIEEGLGETTDFDDIEFTCDELLKSLRSRRFVRDHKEHGRVLNAGHQSAETAPLLFGKALFDITAVALARGWTAPEVRDAVEETRSDFGISSMLAEAAAKDALNGVIRAMLAAGLSRPAILEVLDDLGCRFLEHPEEFE